MNTEPQQEVTEEQLAIMTTLLEDLDQDAYVVIPVAALPRQLMVAWNEVYRQGHGRVTLGRLSFRVMANLMQLGFVLDTKHSRAKVST